MYAALSMAERAGATGKDLITAMAMGYEIAGRIGESIPRETRVVGTPPNLTLESVRTKDFAYHVFACLAAAAKIINLGNDKLANAFGIAGVNAPINATSAMKDYTGVLPMMKYSCAGIHPVIGIMAALLAEQGVTGGTEILDGEHGFYDLMGVPRLYPEALTENMGKKWWIDESAFKFYPSCRISHPAIDAVYSIMKKNNLKPEEVKTVDYGLNPRVAGHFDVLKLEESLDAMSIQFCWPLALAMAAYDIEPGPDWHAEENLKDPRILEFAKKVNRYPDPKALEVVYKEVGNEPKSVRRIVTTITITTQDGRDFTEYREFAKGDPWDPATVATDEDLNRKFRAFSKKVLSAGQIEKIIEAAYKLDEFDNVRSFTGMLADKG